MLELDGDGLSVVGQVEAGTTLVDGMNVGSVRDVVLRDRRHLASDGVLIVVATIAADTAEPIAEPEIIARGFIEPSDDGNDPARPGPRRRWSACCAECQAHRTTEVHLVQQELHDALAELVSHETGKRPMVLPRRRRGLGTGGAGSPVSPPRPTRYARARWGAKLPTSAEAP